MDIVIGTFYELPDGRITKTFHGDGRKKVVGHHFDRDNKTYYTRECDCIDWKQRSDLYDYPNASNPKLPYIFDLFWDIKYMSNLRDELVGHDEEDEIREVMKKHNITLKNTKCDLYE